MNPIEMNERPLLPDILTAGLKVIFVGAAASPRSARSGHWYAGPTNKFYLLLYQAGFTPRQLNAEEDVELLRYGIGLTCIHPYVSSSANHLLPPPTEALRTALAEKLQLYAPHIICYNGKDVYRMATGHNCSDWGEQESETGSSRIFVVHSSSSRADHWGRERLAVYHELKRLAKTT